MKQVLSNPDQAGHIITSRRNALNLSQKAVAAKLGISQNRLSELEEDASRLTLERFIALANLLGLELVIQNKPAKQNSESEW